MRLIVLLLVLTLLVGPIAFAAASFQPDPILPQTATLSPRQAVQSRALISRAKAVASGTDRDGQIQASEAELNALIATGARVVRPLLGRTDITADALRLRVAAQVPGMPQLGWVNLEATIAPSQTSLDVTELTLGRIRLPPRLTVAALSAILDLATPDDLGTLLLSSITALETRDGMATLTLDAGGDGADSLFARTVTQLRVATGRPPNDAIKRHFDRMQTASQTGTLPAGGSTASWVGFAVAQVVEAGHQNASELRTDLRAALIALAAHCGDHRAIETVVGPLGSDRSRCDGTRLANRRDLRQHFTLSAGFQAAGGTAISFGLGEVKELVDAGRDGGSGHSFDDIAGNLAGIRLAERLGRATPETIGPLAARITGEAAIMPSIDGLPTRLSAADFAAQFGSVDSPAYRAMLEEINARIDALPFHQP